MTFAVDWALALGEGEGDPEEQASPGRESESWPGSSGRVDGFGAGRRPGRPGRGCGPRPDAVRRAG